MADKYESLDTAFESTDENIDDIQKSIDKLDNELLRLNAEIINRKGSQRRAVKDQIRNIEQALKRKQTQYKRASYNLRSASKIGKGGGKKTMDSVIRGVEAVSGIVGGLTGTSQIGNQISDLLPTTKSLDMPDQQLDEVTVTAPKKEDFISKYKYYLIGGFALLLLLMFKKK
jgi:hypothetical protein